MALPHKCLNWGKINLENYLLDNNNILSKNICYSKWTKDTENVGDREIELEKSHFLEYTI